VQPDPTADKRARGAHPADGARPDELAQPTPTNRSNATAKFCDRPAIIGLCPDLQEDGPSAVVWNL
jgi:hypothetical protein